MAGTQESFTSLQLGGVVKILFLQRKLKKDIHTKILQILLQNCPSYSSFRTWVSRFMTGHFSVENEHVLGSPHTVTDTDTSTAVHDLILEERQSKKGSRGTGHLPRACRVYILLS